MIMPPPSARGALDLLVKNPLLEEVKFASSLLAEMQKENMHSAESAVGGLLKARAELCAVYQMVCEKAGVKDPAGYAKRFTMAAERWLRDAINQEFELGYDNDLGKRSWRDFVLQFSATTPKRQ